MPDARPQRLYKYQPFTTYALENLKGRQIWFSAPAAFNDPFDCAAVVSSAEMTPEERNLVSELFEPSSTTPDTTRVVEVEGSTPTTELAEKLGLSVGSGAQSVGGLLIQALGRIPRAGERFTYQGLEFDILAASVTRVERVAVRPGPVRTIALGGSA